MPFFSRIAGRLEEYLQDKMNIPCLTLLCEYPQIPGLAVANPRSRFNLPLGPSLLTAAFLLPMNSTNSRHEHTGKHPFSHASAPKGPLPALLTATIPTAGIRARVICEPGRSPEDQWIIQEPSTLEGRRTRLSDTTRGLAGTGP